MNDRTSHFTSMLYFLAGAVAGGGVALLVAPQAGKLTREIMRRKLRDTTDSARDLKDRVVRRSEEIRDEAGHRATDVASALAGRTPRKMNGQDDKVASA
jgi:gas vesicle protein